MLLAELKLAAGLLILAELSAACLQQQSLLLLGI
jgi:hypothetical protein